MIFRELDSNNDWQFGRGLQNMTRQNQAIGLNIKTRIQSWVGDCFFDLQAGIDWWNRLGSKNQRSLLELDLRRIILQSEGVTGLVEFQTNVVGRRFSASYTVTILSSQEFQDTLEVEV